MKRILLFLILISLVSCEEKILISLISCEEKDDLLGMTFDKEAYNENRNLWQGNKILNYTFAQQYFSTSVGGQPELSTIVRNNELENITIKSSAKNVRIGELIYFDNITDLFDFIGRIVKDANEQINSSDNAMEGAIIDVKYDETYHYPTKISCKGYYPKGYVGGLSISIFVNDFEVN